MKMSRCIVLLLLIAASFTGCGQPQVASGKAPQTIGQMADGVVRPRLDAGKELAVYKNGVRNPACWAYGLELTAFAPGVQDGCLITPSVYMVAAHDPGLGVGGVITFFSKTSEKISRKVTKQVKAATYARPKYGSPLPDVTLFLLDSPLPAAIVPVKFLPVDWAKYIDNNGAGIPIITINNLEEALVLSTLAVQQTDSATAGNAQRTRYKRQYVAPFGAFSKAINGAESGSPAFLATTDEAVLLSLTQVWLGSMDTRAGTAWTDPQSWAALEKALKALGTIERPARADFSRFRRLN